MEIEELFQRYELAMQAQGYSQKTVVHVKGCVRIFIDFLGNKPVSDITADDFRHFIAELRNKDVWAGLPYTKGRKLTSTTINTYARAIKSFWQWLEREGIIKSNPLASIPAPKKAKTLPKVYSEDQLRAVLEVIMENLRNRAIIEVLLDSGVRLSELVSLDISNIDLKTGRIKVLGKGGKERYTYITQSAIQTVNDYIAQSRPMPVGENLLFLNLDGSPLKYNRIQKILELIGRKAGISERLCPHKLRHSCATLSLKYGNNLEYIKLMLGHSNIKTTSEAYLNVADTDVANAHQKFSPLANLMSTGPTEPATIEIEGRRTAALEILVSEMRLTVKPPGGEPHDSAARFCLDFTVDIDADVVFIESIEVFTTEPRIAYRLYLFAVKAPYDPLDWEYDDLIQAPEVKKRVYSRSLNPPLRYRNYDRTRKIYCGICMGRRPLRFDLDDEKEKEDYYEAPVTYTITLRYRL